MVLLEGTTLNAGQFLAPYEGFGRKREKDIKFYVVLENIVFGSNTVNYQIYIYIYIYIYMGGTSQDVKRLKKKGIFTLNTSAVLGNFYQQKNVNGHVF